MSTIPTRLPIPLIALIRAPRVHSQWVGRGTGCKAPVPVLIRKLRASPLFHPVCRLAAIPQLAVHVLAASRLAAGEPNPPATAAARIMNCMEKAQLGSRFTAQSQPTIAPAIPRHHRLSPLPRLYLSAADALLLLEAEQDAHRPQLPKSSNPQVPGLALPRKFKPKRCARWRYHSKSCKESCKKRTGVFVDAGL